MRIMELLFWMVPLILLSFKSPILASSYLANMKTTVLQSDGASQLYGGNSSTGMSKAEQTVQDGTSSFISHREDHRLCLASNSKENLVHCEHNSSKYACIRLADGNIQPCHAFPRSNLAVPVCLQADDPRLIMCGMLGKAYLCYPKTNGTSMVLPCKDRSRHFCVSRDGKLERCPEQEHLRRIKRQLPSAQDSKFYRLLCDNCTIETKMVVHDSTGYEVEMFTFPS